MLSEMKNTTGVKIHIEMNQAALKPPEMFALVSKLTQDYMPHSQSTGPKKDSYTDVGTRIMLGKEDRKAPG